MKATRCIVEGCERGGRIVRGLCNLHYLRWRKYGTPDIPPVNDRCSVTACERRGQTRRGLCGTHYSRWLTHGTTEPTPQHAPAVERLAAGLTQMSSGCLEWTGHLNFNGYGRISVNGKQDGTHRVAWMLANGPIPDGLWVLHHCDNPPCCQTNPTEGYPDGHLFLGTVADNQADMAAKSRHGRYQSKKTHCPQGHPYDEANTYITKRGKRHCRACGRAAANRARAYHRKRQET